MQKKRLYLCFLLNMLHLEATLSFACLRCHQVHLNPIRRIPKKLTEGWKEIDIHDYLKMLRSKVTVHLHTIIMVLPTCHFGLCVHIRSINIRMYITMEGD